MIHSGIYYPAESLKTALCIRGRDLLYERCRSNGIAHRKTGKLIVATAADQTSYLKGLADKAAKIHEMGIGRVPLEWLDGDRARQLEPDLSEDVAGALLCSETGIVSSHELMEDLEKSQSCQA